MKRVGALYRRKSPDRAIPAGVVLFVYLIIAGSVISLLYLKEAVAAGSGALSWMYLVISPASIVAAAYLLKTDNRARNAIIAISAVVAAETALSAPGMMVAIRSLDMSGIKTAVSREIAEAIAGAAIIFSIAFNVSVMLYFTRPKIREMYEKKG